MLFSGIHHIVQHQQSWWHVYACVCMSACRFVYVLLISQHVARASALFTFQRAGLVHTDHLTNYIQYKHLMPVQAESKCVACVQLSRRRLEFTSYHKLETAAHLLITVIIILP